MEDIWLYTYQEWSFEQANIYHEKITDAFDMLVSKRKQGRNINSVRSGYLKIAVGEHFIFYKKVSFEIEIIRVLHQRMDIDKYL